MAIERFNLTFNALMSKQPVIYNIGKSFDLVTVIERANISDESGWVQLALNGDPDEIQRAIADLNTKGVFISPIELSTLS